MMMMDAPDNIASATCGGIPPSPPTPVSSPGSSIHSIKSAVYLPPDYVPGSWDVICQRGKDCHEHVGNRRFRVCVENHVDGYMNAKTRQEKSSVITNIVKSIEASCATHRGGFVMKDPKSQRWHHVDNKVARDKVGNALRDAVKQREEGGGFGLHINADGSPNITDSSLSWINSEFQLSQSAAADAMGSEMDIITHQNPFEGATKGGEQTQQFNSSLFEEENVSPYYMLQFQQQLKKSTCSSDPFITGQRGVMDHQSFQYLDQGCFSIEPTTAGQMKQQQQYLGNGSVSTRIYLETLDDSMDTDMDDLFEPRPIEMLQRKNY